MQATTTLEAAPQKLLSVDMLRGLLLVRLCYKHRAISQLMCMAMMPQRAAPETGSLGCHRFMDSGASAGVRVLRQSPASRLIVLAYLVGLHLFIYLLLGRLQHRAMGAESIGIRLPRDH